MRISRTAALLLILLALPTSLSKSYTDVSVEGAFEILRTDPAVYLLDVRTPSEYSSGHISGAFLIPDYELQSRGNELPSDMSAPILVYCRSGARSAASSAQLAGMGYTNITNMLGGFLAWSSMGYPSTVGGERGTFPVAESAILPVFAAMIPLGLGLRRRLRRA